MLVVRRSIVRVDGKPTDRSSRIVHHLLLVRVCGVDVVYDSG